MAWFSHFHRQVHDKSGPKGRVSYADLLHREISWQRLVPLLDKLPLWASYFFVILCTFGMGYSLGSARFGVPGAARAEITLAALAAGALLVLLIVIRTLRREERRRVASAERIRLSKEAVGMQLLDPVERAVLVSLDEIAEAKGIDRATLVPAILSQYVARKTFEAALREEAVQRKREPEPPPGWHKTLPAWLETLPGSFDVSPAPEPRPYAHTITRND